MNYYVYIIRSDRDESYYVGSTQDIEARLTRHNQGRSRYTRNRGPWVVVYFEEYSRRADAVKREKAIKNRKSRDYIESLIRASRQTWREGREFKSRHSRHNKINGLRTICSPFFMPEKSISNLGDKNQGKKRYFLAKKNSGSGMNLMLGLSFILSSSTRLVI